jgi:anti-sigma factor RsiW
VECDAGTGEDAIVSPDCREIRELIDSYLSEELLVETNHRVLRHLETCQACEAEARRRQRLRVLLAQTLDEPIDVEPVRQRVTRALDTEPRSWMRVARWWGVAAVLMLGIAVALWFSRPVDAAAYDDSAGNHVACALAMPPVMYDSSRVARQLAAPFEGIAEGIGLTHGAYHVIDAHMCPYMGRDYAHVVLRGNGQTLSLFAEQARRGALPVTPVTTVLPGDPLQVHSTTRLGYRVSATGTPGYRLFLVSERPAEAPDDTTNEILLSAVRFVHSLER